MRHPSHSKLPPEPLARLLTRPLSQRTLQLPTPARPLARPSRYCARWTRATASRWAGRTARAGRRGAGPLRRGALERADGRAGAAHAWRRNGGRQSGQLGSCGDGEANSAFSKTHRLASTFKSRLSWLAAGQVAWRPRSKARSGTCVRCFVLTDYAQGRPRV